MTSHTDQHEQLVRDVIVGDLAPDDPSVTRRRTSCPDCRRLLDGALRTAALLDQDRAEQEELLDLAARVDDAPLASVEAMRDHPEIRRPWTPARRPGPSRGTIAAALALAAAVLAVFLILFRDEGGPGADPGPRMLGDEQGSVVLLEPTELLSADGGFAWTVGPDLADQVGYYEVVVQGAGSLPVTLGQTRDTTWKAPDATVLPERFDWWVVVHGLADEVLSESGHRSVRRSP